MYVPISILLPKLLNRGDVTDKILEQSSTSQSDDYKSFHDGLYYKQNPLFSGGEDLAISIGLYVDEFEICNPSGTSRKKNTKLLLFTGYLQICLPDTDQPYPVYTLQY